MNGETEALEKNMIYLILKKNLKQLIGLREKKKEVFAGCWFQIHFQSQTVWILRPLIPNGGVCSASMSTNAGDQLKFEEVLQKLNGYHIWGVSALTREEGGGEEAGTCRLLWVPPRAKSHQPDEAWGSLSSGEFGRTVEQRGWVLVA